MRYLADSVPRRSRALFEKPQTPTVTTSFVPDLRMAWPGAGGGPPPREQTIEGALEAYRRAFQARDIAALLEVFPKYPDINAIRAQFNDASNVSLAFGDPSIKATSETTAVVTVQNYTIGYTTRTGKSESIRPRRAEFYLRKDGATWVIDSLVFR
jgi:hypothetical protein